jgi:ribosomal protein S18 acetylase RimI-like enzyme
MSKPSDVEQIVRVCSEGYRRTYPGLLSATTIEDVVRRYYQPDRIRSEIQPDPPGWSGYLVAEDDEGQVAAAGGGGMTGVTVGELFVLYVDPDRRGRGFGSAVLELLTEQQRGLGATEQWVSVQKNNTKGIPFYQARGFTFVEEVEPWDGTGTADGARTWRMRRPIPRV